MSDTGNTEETPAEGKIVEGSVTMKAATRFGAPAAPEPVSAGPQEPTYSVVSDNNGRWNAIRTDEHGRFHHIASAQSEEAAQAALDAWKVEYGVA